VPKRISSVLGVSAAALNATGTFNGFVDIDSRLHVDPHLLSASAVPELAGSRQRFEEHFRQVLKLGIPRPLPIRDPGDLDHDVGAGARRSGRLRSTVPMELLRVGLSRREHRAVRGSKPQLRGCWHVVKGAQMQLLVQNAVRAAQNKGASAALASSPQRGARVPAAELKASGGAVQGRTDEQAEWSC